METPFTITPDGRELLDYKITLLSTVDLIATLLALCVVFGVERVELSIKATYCREDADKIITMMNFSSLNHKTGE